MDGLKALWILEVDEALCRVLHKQSTLQNMFGSINEVICLLVVRPKSKN